ncbi:MFS monosaccharide transporter [Coccidioides immitis RS]|uniref:MFS monosaccharide transporter n=1 Tax=Coccidioides immitis (strain RS) TaxID=246410 RepID=J3KIA9_COCIM|nr:MFS monosaccharide transporter [Coccidioides immitis RS]EAS35688.3 MFS monosaccharide transporter [Coccidioides immitis RS]
MDYSMQLIMSSVLHITQLVGVVSKIWTMDHFDRRPILLWGSVAMTTSHIIITALAGLFDKHLPSHRSEGPLGHVVRYVVNEPSHRCFVKVVSADSTFRSLPIVSPRQGWRPLDPLRLVQQFYQRPYHHFPRPKRWLWRVCRLRIPVPPIIDLVLSFIPGTSGRTLKQMDHVFKD